MARLSTAKGLLFSCGGIVLCGVLTFAALVYLFFLPGESGRLHQMTLEDGTEFRLIQEESNFLYNVGLYLKHPGEKWGWCFVDKEERSWKGRGKMVWDSERQTIGIYRGSDRLAEYSPSARTITVFRMYQPIRRASPIDGDPPY